jgi:hypothetical protein
MHAIGRREPERALTALDTSLALADPQHLHNRVFTQLLRAEALVQQGRPAEASALICDVVTVAAVNSTGRIDQRVAQLRAMMSPWQRTKAVRDLDGVIRSYRPGALAGTGATGRVYPR